MTVDYSLKPLAVAKRHIRCGVSPQSADYPMSLARLSSGTLLATIAATVWL